MLGQYCPRDIAHFNSIYMYKYFMYIIFSQRWIIALCCVYYTLPLSFISSYIVCFAHSYTFSFPIFIRSRGFRKYFVWEEEPTCVKESGIWPGKIFQMFYTGIPMTLQRLKAWKIWTNQLKNFRCLMSPSSTPDYCLLLLRLTVYLRSSIENFAQM